MNWNDDNEGYDYRQNAASRGEKSVPPVFNPADIQQQIQNLREGGGLSSTLDVKQDKSGKARWLFFNNLPPEVAGLLQYGFTTIKPFIGKEGGEFVYRQTGRIADWLKKEKATPAGKHAAGLTAAKAFWAALIAAEPIQQLVSTRSQYTEERHELFKSIAPVLQANKGRYKNNEVINAALGRIHDTAMTGVKKMLAEVPVIGLTTYFAVRDYAALRDRKTLELQHTAKASQSHTAAEAERHESYKQTHATIKENTQKWKEHLEAEAIKEGRDPKRKEVQRQIAAEVEKYHQDAWNTYHQNNAIKETERQRRVDDHTRYHRDSGFDDTTAKMALAGAATYLLSSRIAPPRPTEHPIAMDLIQQLAYDVENRKEVPDLKNRIVEIFQQNERDHKRRTVGDRLMPQLDPAIDRITEVIASGNLNPLALVNLVGDGRILMHKGSRRSFANAEQAEALIAEELKGLSSREPVNPAEFFSDFTDPKLVEEALKEVRGSLPEDKKAIFDAVFPTDIVVQMGVKRHDAIESQKKGHDLLYPVIAANILVLAEKTPEELKALGLNEEDRAAITELADKIIEGGRQAKEAVQNAVDGHDKKELAAVRTAAIHAQIDGKDTGVWTKIIERARSLPDLIAERKKQRAARAESHPADEDMERRREEEDFSDRGDGKFVEKERKRERAAASDDEDMLPASAREREARRRDVAAETRELGA